MKVTPKLLLIVAPMFLLGFGACAKSTASSCQPHTRQVGEDCSDECSCMSGLFCESGKCRIICNDDIDCKKGQSCINNKCVGEGSDSDDSEEKPEQKPEQTDTPCQGNECGVPNAGKMPPGGVVVPVSGVIEKDGYTVRVLGGVMDGRASKEDTSVKVNAGTWK